MNNLGVGYTKILATVGAVDGNGSREKLDAIIKSGASGLRINFSHAKYDEVKRQIKWIREISREIDRNVSIVADLQGPKIRLGDLQGDRYELRKGDEIGLAFGITHDGGNILPVQYDLSNKVKPGERMFLFDGKISAEVTAIENLVTTREQDGEGRGSVVKITILNDGFVTSKKGINLPDTSFAGAVLTDKDLTDLDFVLTQDFDYIGMSFVHTADDVRRLKQIIKNAGSEMKVISKIETREAIEIENLEEIVIASDGIMVARGDLAYEIGAEVVPVVKHKVIELCQKHCKFSIIATQMMGSMVSNPQPTRAEVSDVSTAAIEGVDVVMLSEETAVGEYPTEAVMEMQKVLTYVQKNIPAKAICNHVGSDKRRDAIGESVVQLADRLNVDAIIVETRSGLTARNVAIHRPNIPVFTVSGVQKVAQQLPLIFGIRSYFAADIHADYGNKLAEKLFAEGHFGEGEATVIIVKSSTANFEKSLSDTIMVRTLK